MLMTPVCVRSLHGPECARAHTLAGRQRGKGDGRRGLLRQGGSGARPQLAENHSQTIQAWNIVNDLHWGPNSQHHTNGGL